MRVLVANAGTHPEPMRLAIGFVEHGDEVEYWTSSSWARDSLVGRLTAGRLGSTRPGRTVQRRVLPAGLGRTHVRHAAVAREAMFQVAMRRSLTARERSLRSWLDGYERAIARRVRRHRYDVVFAQYMWARDVFAAAPPGTLRVLGYPTAHHDWMQRTFATEAQENPRWAPFLQGFDEPAELIARFDREIELADVVLMPSSFAARTFVESGVPESKLAVVQLAPAIDPDLAAAAVPANEMWGGLDGLRILWAGQVTQRKGLSYLLDAVDGVPEARLQIVGDAMPGITELVLEHDRVHLNGSVPRPVLRSYLAAADVFVLPSLAEGFPLGAIEAMRSGVPTIVSTSTFADDVVTDGTDGFIVPPRDAAALRDALRRVAADRTAARELGRRGADAAARFTWQRYQHEVVRAITEHARR